MSPYNFSQIITQNNIKWSDVPVEEQKTFNLFMVNRNLSMIESNVEIVNDIQKYSKIPTENVFNIYSSLLESGPSYIKYIKKKTEDPNKELYKLLSQYFELSVRETKDICSTMNKDQIGSLLSRLGKTEKEIKKLLK